MPEKGGPVVFKTRELWRRLVRGWHGRSVVPSRLLPLIVEVYPNGYAGDGTDQFVRMYHPGDRAVDLTGWSIGDGKIRAIFPSGARLEPGQSIYLAQSAVGFHKLMGAPPAYAWGESGEGVPPLQGGSGLRLGAKSGAVLLQDPAGKVVDMLVYGAAPAPSPGDWEGAPVPAPRQGEIIDRGRDEAAWTEAEAGPYTRDTDTAADWKQGSAWVDGRVYRPGQSWFGYPTFEAASVTLYASPDNAYPVMSALLDQAERSVDLNVYDFTLTPMAEKLAAAARRGVRVRLLLEAGSAKSLSHQERYMAKLVAEAGGQVRWIVNDSSIGIHGRYVYNHAKYAVVDGMVSLVQSENLVRHGTPVDPTFGNRGWGVIVTDAALAAFLSRVFEADWNPIYGDIKVYKPGTPFGPPPDDFQPERGELSGTYPHPFPSLTVKGPVAVTPVLSPDHTLLEQKGIIGHMRSARDSLLIEQQYVQVHYGRFTTDFERVLRGVSRSGRSSVVLLR
jgi:cardiolipin synthase